MDELKSFFEQNRNLFDTEEPLAGHFERFQQRLEAEHKQRNRFNYRRIMYVAASVVVAVIVSVEAFSALFGKGVETIQSGVETIQNEVAELNINSTNEFVRQTTQNVKSKLNPEYRETQKYYITEVDNRLDQIKATSMDEEQKAELLKELSEMDELFAKLQKELKSSPDNQVLIEAMINHYKMKIEVMNQIINNLNSIKTLNTQNNEKVDL
ncbi:MAG: hypothetical protein J6U13_07665 [Salinivirgaceae bacterium]|nr:hypothetical protein [Salinivirgaceae bacterium]MBR5167856.1 hypothetical protein [Salinivirgaceae bacterium]